MWYNDIVKGLRRICSASAQGSEDAISFYISVFIRGIPFPDRRLRGLSIYVKRKESEVRYSAQRESPPESCRIMPHDAAQCRKTPKAICAIM